jgi:acetyl-CoA carboxylase biotin carboxylase subunit
MEIADEIGFPLIIKASAGGGGRGMRIVHAKDGFSNAFQSAQTEAYQAFGSRDVYIEKYFIGPHHVEIQILSDHDGNVVAMGERDCSVQRRHQKLLEETPSPLLTPSVRLKMSDLAIRAAKACGYVNAGTIEFLVDDKRNFYFIEMNTRIQVEHPITEQAFNYDLVKAQILIAAGRSIEDVPKSIGHTIECRINAEDPWTFTPSPGTITRMIQPGGPGVRIDSWVTTGSVISPHYDSLLSKVIVTGRNRDEAIARMKRALSEYLVEGIKTTIPLHLTILDDPDFIKGKYDTGFIEKVMAKREKRLLLETIQSPVQE